MRLCARCGEWKATEVWSDPPGLCPPCTPHRHHGRTPIYLVRRGGGYRRPSTLRHAAPPTPWPIAPLAVLALLVSTPSRVRTRFPLSPPAPCPSGGSGEFCHDGCQVTGFMWAAAYTALYRSGFSAVYNSSRYARGGRGGALILLSSTPRASPSENTTTITYL